VTSSVTVDNEMDEGWVKLRVRWKPALRTIASRVGYVVVILVVVVVVAET